MLGLAIIALEAGEYQRTTELCEQCMLTNPGNPRIPLLLAESYLQDGQANKSILVLSKHIASQPTSVQALEMLGTAYLNLRDYENPRTHFTGWRKRPQNWAALKRQCTMWHDSTKSHRMQLRPTKDKRRRSKLGHLLQIFLRKFMLIQR